MLTYNVEWEGKKGRVSQEIQIFLLSVDRPTATDYLESSLFILEYYSIIHLSHVDNVLNHQHD